MSSENFAGNIIINLASLPDFLRTSMLKKRMIEFFSLPEEEKKEIINNALMAGPGIPFPNFSKLLKTWLEILSSLSEEQRREILSLYVDQAVCSPQKFVAFHLDGILETFLALDGDQRAVLAGTIRRVVSGLDEGSKRRLDLMILDGAKKQLGI